MPKDKGGVVDTNLKVYGTKNIRVADLSVLPVITAVHTQGPSPLPRSSPCAPANRIRAPSDDVRHRRAR